MTETKETRSRAATDPAQIPVQFTLRVPWQYHQQLAATAARQKKSMNALVLDSLKIIHPEEQ